MTRIETEVYKQTANDLIGLRVIVYDNNSRPINNIIVVQPEDLIRIQNNLIEHNHDDRYVSIESVSARIREIAEDLFENAERKNYRPPTFYVEDDGDFYVEYHEGELIANDNVEIDLESRHITTYNGNFTITGLITNNDEPLTNRDVLLYNINDNSEHYFTKTNINGIVTFNLSLDVPTKTYRMSISGTVTDIEITYTKYNIENEVGTIANEQGEATISAVLKNWNNIVEDETIELLLNDTVIDSDITDENGEVNFDVTVGETTWYELKFTKPNNEVIKKEFGVQYIPVWQEYTFQKEDTQYWQPINSGTVQVIDCNSEENNGAEFYFEGTNGYIDLPWDNNLWEFECDIQFNSQAGIALIQQGVTSRDKYEIFYVNNTTGNNSTTLRVGGYLHWLPQSFYDSNFDYYQKWFYLTIKKISEDQIVTNIYNIEDKETPLATHTLDYVGYGCSLNNLCLGFTSWGNGGRNTTLIRSAKIKWLNFVVPVLKETYHPLLDGTEEITLIRSHLPIISDNEMSIYGDWQSYLTQGFPNTDFWEVTVDLAWIGTNSSCDFFICNKDVTARRKQSINFEVGNNNTYSESDKTYSQTETKWTHPTSEWTTFTVTKINDKYIKFSNPSNIYDKIYWNNSSYETLCVGIGAWGTNSDFKIKNIHVKTSLEDTLNTIE